jgi:hypothetical protein
VRKWSESIKTASKNIFQNAPLMIAKSNND